MEIKEWLRRGRNLNKRIQALEASKAMAYGAATRTTPAYGQRSGGGSEISRKPERYSELSDALDRELEKRESIMREITDLISHVEDNTLGTLLQDYYVLGLTWEETARHLKYSREYVIAKLHPKALAAAQKVFTEYYSASVL